MATSSIHTKLFWLSCTVVSVLIARSFSQNIQEWAESKRAHARFLEESLQKAGEGSRAVDVKADAKKQGTEYDLSVGTLEVLCRHPNYDIRQAARKIALYRFAHSNECTARLRRDLRDTDSRREATDVLRSLVMEVEPTTLLGDDITATDPHDFEVFLDDFLNGEGTQQRQPRSNRSLRQGRPLERQGPMLTLEEVEGENGEIVSVRVPAMTMVGLEGQTQIDANAAEHELRRWQRREAMVVQFDNDEDGDLFDNGIVTGGDTSSEEGESDGE